MLKSLIHSMNALHTWGGLVFGWLLFGVLLSGSAAVYHPELTTWLTPELSSSSFPPDRMQALQLGEAHLRRHAADARLWRITLPSARDPALKVSWRAGSHGPGDARLDLRSGAPILRETEGGEFYLKYHEGLHIDRGKNRIGLYIVGLAGVAMMVAAISGVIVHKRIFKDLFLFRTQGSRQRRWLDAHNLLGVLPLPFHVMMAYTGLLLLYWMYVPAGVQALYGGKEPPFRREAITLQYQQLGGPPGAPRPTLALAGFVQAAEARLGRDEVAYLWIRDHDRANAVVEAYRQRTDRVSQQVPQVAFEGATGRVVRVVARRSPAAEVQSFVAALHWLEWGGPGVRLVYFLAGAAGAGAVACGLALFTVKRERRAEAQAGWMRGVHALNVAAVAGFCVACAAFLWAERLIAADRPGRAEEAVAAFFWVWLACLVHPLLRRSARAAWIEQLALAAALCTGAPFLGGLVFRDLATADAVRLGVDAGLLALGATLAVGARAVSGATRRPEAALQPRTG